MKSENYFFLNFKIEYIYSIIYSFYIYIHVSHSNIYFTLFTELRLARKQHMTYRL